MRFAFQGFAFGLNVKGVGRVQDDLTRQTDRSYTRSLTLKEDGTFLASDLVAPCPKDARCFWSGIVVRSGTWRFDRDLIELTLVSESRPGTASQLPQFLRREGEGKLVEVVVALCAGTTDAQTTIGCYQVEIHSGSGFQQAIAACGT